MLAAERGAAANTLAAYRRDLEGAEEAIGDLEHAQGAALASLGSAWASLAPSTVARKSSALRQFYGFLIDEGRRKDDPSTALPRPAARRPLPKILSHQEVERLFMQAETEGKAAGPKPSACSRCSSCFTARACGQASSSLFRSPRFRAMRRS